MQYIVASLGRCGSTLVAHAIGCAAERPVWITRDLSSAPCGRQVIKTHAHFQGELLEPFRAVFVWGFVEDIFASLMSIRDRGWMLAHLAHLQVRPEHIEVYRMLSRRRRYTAVWRYLVEGDKLRFVENVRSWARAKALFIQYEKLCMYPEWKSRKISNYLDLDVPLPAIRPRQSDWRELPRSVHRAIQESYPSWIRRVK